MKKLTIYYYLMPTVTLIIAAVFYYLLKHNYLTPLDPFSHTAVVLQYLAIFDTLLCVPLGLWYHKRICQKRLSKIEDKQEQSRLYEQSAIKRILIVAHPMILAIALYYLLGGYMSMIWVAAVSAIAWVFTKPTEHKKFLELINEDEEKV